MTASPRAPLDLIEAREIASQFLAGLEAIHAANLVHRDVKPENIMMTRSGRLVMMDFGIAKGLAEGRSGTVAGTPAYMAPEQARGEGVDARADVFSAGVVLAEMIAPQGLATHEARAAIWEGIHREPPLLLESPWGAVLRRAVSRRPEERHATAAASKGRFRSFLLASLKIFLSHERERATAIKRGGGAHTVSLDSDDAERRFQREPVESLTPEQVFERRWGLTVMERAMERLEIDDELRYLLTAIRPWQSDTD